MAVEGSLDLFQLPEILQIISQEHKTGILTVQGKEDIVAISFLSGRVVAADALNQTLEDGLGQVLLKRRLLTQESYEKVQVEKRRTQGRLIDVLVDTGALERSEVLDALRILTLDLLGELLDWREGEFKFYGGDEVSYEEGFRPIAIEDLLLANLPQATEKAPEESPEPPRPEPLQERLPPSVPAEPEADPATPDPAAFDPPDLTEPDLPEVTLRPPEPAKIWKPSSPAVEDPGISRVESVPIAIERERATPSRARTARTWSAEAWRQPLAWALGLFSAAALVVVLVTFPSRFLLPMVTEQREAFEESRRTASYAKIESAVRSFALMEARLPDQLEVLTHLHMLSADEVRGPLAQPLLYEVDELVYTLRPLLTEEDTAFAGSLIGDFLRDPALVRDRDARAVAPLELLD